MYMKYAHLWKVEMWVFDLEGYLEYERSKMVPELRHAIEGQHSIWGFLGFTEEKQTFYLWTNFKKTLEHFGDEKYEYANQK